MTEKRLCLECNEELLGRADQKFCSDYCRNAFNNKRRSADKKHVKGINKILAKNRDLLQQFYPGKNILLRKMDMVKKGFDFTYFTNIYTTKTGKTYYYCYEFGYTFIEEESGKVLIVKKEDYI